MSQGKKLIGILRNNLFAHRESDRPASEVPDTVSTLEDIASQVRKEAAENPQISEVKEFLAQPPKPEKKATREKAARPAKAAEEKTGKPKKTRKKRHTKLTALQFEELIEKDCTVLEIMGQVMDRNVEIRSQLKTTPT